MHDSPIKTVNIVGIEPSEQMSLAAKERLGTKAKETDMEANLEIIRGTGEGLTSQQAEEIGQRGIDVVIATISIHHSPEEQKREALKRVRQMRPKLFILADVNSNHEANLAKFSPELMANVRRFYSLAYQSQVEWARTKYDNSEAIVSGFKKFNFDEARNIAGRNYTGVEDYHTTAENWLRLLKGEGFLIVDPRNKGFEASVEGETDVTDETFFTYTYEGQNLFFVIGATPK